MKANDWESNSNDQFFPQKNIDLCVNNKYVNVKSSIINSTSIIMYEFLRFLAHIQQKAVLCNYNFNYNYIIQNYNHNLQ